MFYGQDLKGVVGQNRDGEHRNTPLEQVFFEGIIANKCLVRQAKNYRSGISSCPPSKTCYILPSEVNIMRILTALKHLLKPHPKNKGSFGNSDTQKLNSLFPELTTPEIRNVSEDEKPSEE